MDWSCDFYVNYWPDVIEEEALNEKSCLQVLRILIAKSDNEIEGLEGELLFLETHLERADKNKAEEWFDICCKELNEKIQSLELSICSLKDERIQNENDHGVQSQTSREPAKKVHDIIKEASLKNIYVKHEPPANTSYEDLLDTFSSQFRNSDSANIKVEEVIESNFTAKDQITKERMRLNQHEAMKVQEAGAIVSVSTHFSDSSLIVQGQGVTNIVQLAQVESQEPTPAPATDKAFRLIPSLKSQEQGRKNIILSEISKGQGKKARSYRKTAPKSTPKTVTRTPKTPKAPKIPESRTQSDWFVQKTGMSSVKPGGAKKRKQEQLDDENFSSQTNGNKVSRTVTDDVIESGDAFTQSRANLNSIFKSEDKTNNHGTMQLDAVEVKDPCVSPFRIPKFENLHRLTVAQMKDIAKSCGLKGLAHKKKDQIIRSLEEYTGRQL